MESKQSKLTNKELRLTEEIFAKNMTEYDHKQVFWNNERLFCRFDEWDSVHDWHIQLNTYGEYFTPGYRIFPRAPFYREYKKTIAILGIESGVWMYNRTADRGYCNALNCNKPVTFITQKPIGHVFFFDIDEKISYKELTILLEAIMYEQNISHFIITETTKGYHVWSTEIKNQKIAWFPVFLNLKYATNSDYEFNSQWILRIGRKGNRTPPRYIGSMVNEEILRARCSNGHLAILRNYAYMSSKVIPEHLHMNTYARLVQYKSWDVDTDD